MSVITLPRVPKGVSVEQLAEIVAGLSENLEFLLTGNLSTVNAREFAGWRINQQAIQSKDGKVGMSTVETADDDIRFWAGDILTGIPVWYVTKGGLMVAANADIKGKITAESGKIGGFTIELDKLVGTGIIEGGTLRSGPGNEARIELSGNAFRGLDSSGQRSGLFFEITPTGIADLHLYHLGFQLLTFFDNIDSVTVRQGADAAVMALGETGKFVNANGSWTFESPISGSIEHAGSADYATTAGSTSSLEPGSTIAWSQVSKTASNVADLATKNLADMTQSSTHRTVADTEKSTWNGKWGDDTTSSRSSFSAYRSGTNQAIPAAQYTKLQCNAERFDNKNEYDSTTNYDYTCSVAGNYSVCAAVRFLAQPAGNASIVRVDVNGVERTRLWQNTCGAAGLVVAGGADEIDLVVGDKVTVMVYTAAADNVEAGIFSRFKMTKIA